jgi:predicted RNase H-like nuclease (RuvC/YqgF family)
MTDEERSALRAILREEIAAAEQRMGQRQDRAVEALTTNQSEAVAELRAEFAGLNDRIDNLAPVIIATDARMAAFTRSMDKLIGGQDETRQTLKAQQHAIDQLAAQLAETRARLDALEKKAS